MKKGVVLTIVMGVALVVFTLALSALYLMTNESRIAEHKIKRMRGFYAAQAGFVLAVEQLRNGNWNMSETHCINGPILGLPACSTTINDPAIPYNVVMDIGPAGSSIDGIGAEISITARYNN